MLHISLIFGARIVRFSFHRRGVGIEITHVCALIIEFIIRSLRPGGRGSTVELERTERVLTRTAVRGVLFA